MKQILFILVISLTPIILYSQQISKPKMERVIPTQEIDPIFIRKAIEAGKAEIMMGSLAKSNSTNPEIIDFGKMMEEDHISLNEKLERIAQQRNIKFNEQSSMESDISFDKLRNLQGPNFDREFISNMIKYHTNAIELFSKQAKDGMDGELKNLAKESLPTLENHLKQIEKLKLQIIQ